MQGCFHRIWMYTIRLKYMNKKRELGGEKLKLDSWTIQDNNV